MKVGQAYPLHLELCAVMCAWSRTCHLAFGTVVFAMFAGFYLRWSKVTGRMRDEKLGKRHSTLDWPGGIGRAPLTVRIYLATAPPQ